MRAFATSYVNYDAAHQAQAFSALARRASGLAQAQMLQTARSVAPTDAQTGGPLSLRGDVEAIVAKPGGRYLVVVSQHALTRAGRVEAQSQQYEVIVARAEHRGGRWLVSRFDLQR